MPTSEYFGGNGNKVMDNMTKEYGDKKGKSVFYATANAKGQKPGDSKGGKKAPPFGKTKKLESLHRGKK